MNRKPIGVMYGFRILFVGWVALFHIWQQGWLGQYATIFGISLNFDYITRSAYVFVDAMLMMSAWLLYLPHARRRVNGSGRIPGAGEFYRKRLERILPCYLAAVLLCLLLRAIPQKLYPNASAMWMDVITHLTFTFNFFPATYIATPLNGALWTIAVEMQFYLLFPLLARSMDRRPLLTAGAMAAVGILWRVIVMRQPDTNMLLNQMPSFGDVFALGFLGALVYAQLEKATDSCPDTARRLFGGAAVILSVPALIALSALLKCQSAAGAPGPEALRQSQMLLRLPFAAAYFVLMLSAAFWPPFLQKLLDNRLSRFLAAISMNLYICHQVLAVEIRQSWFSDITLLHSDKELQMAYTVLCICVSILTAWAATVLIEEPGRKLIRRLLTRKNPEPEAPERA